MKRSLILYILIISAYLNINAQHRVVPDFTDLYDPAVTCYYGDFSDPKANTGILPQRHKMISTQGFDANTDNRLPIIPEGESRVIKLGNDMTESKAEAITYRFEVDPYLSILLLKFAVVFQDPGEDHQFDERPRFVVKVTNPDGQLVDDCAIYDVTAFGDVEGFIKGIADEEVRWRPWTSVGIDLTTYIGQEIIVEFDTYDCADGAHYGYAYYTASCIPNRFEFSNCTNPITVTAPAFFQSYQWNNGDTTQSTQYVISEGAVDVECHITSVTSCDFTLTAQIASDIPISAQDTIIHDTTCIRNPYSGFYFELPEFETPGNYAFVKTLLDINTCEDHTITLMLNVIDKTPDGIYYDSICLNGHYQRYGFDTIVSQLGLHELQRDTISPSGCDSTIRVILDVKPPYRTTVIDTACFGEGYHKHGFDYDSIFLSQFVDTIFYDSTLLQSIYGCDSMVRLELLIGRIYDTIFFDSICFGEGYHMHGFDIDSIDARNHCDTLPLLTTLGCDSLIILYLTVNPVYDTTILDTTCFGENYHEHGFELDSLSVGTHLDTLFLSSIFGCDSIVKLNLLVAPLTDTAFADMICFGDRYYEHGFKLDSLPVGLHHDTLNLLDAFGCDSMVTLELIVNPTFDTIFTDMICHGESYHEHGFELDSLQAGFHRDTLTLPSVLGCDSVTFLELYVAPIYDTLFIDTICPGESYHEHGFDLDSLEVGMHHETLAMQTILDCDSMVRLNLLVTPKHDLHFRDTICYGQNYHRYGFDVTLPEIGMYHEEQSFTDVFGCDSLRTLDLLVGQEYYLYVNDTACENQYYTNYGLYLPPMETDIYYLISELQTIAHCDSIFYITLKVVDEYDEIGEIYGDSTLFVSTNIITGRYRYMIDTLPECNQYVWSLDSSALSNKWILNPDYNTCEVFVKYPGEGNLTVRAINRCSDVSKSMHLSANYYGIDENETVKATVYPNPCRHFITIESKNIEKVNVINATGVIVVSKKFEREDKVRLGLECLPSSVYLFEIYTTEGKCMKRVMLNNN